MSIEAVDGADSCEKIDCFDQQDFEKAKGSQERANHQAHFYGSSIEQCSGALPVNGVRRDAKEGIARGEIPAFHLASNKDFVTTLLLCFFFGALGLHRFYVGKPLTGLLQLCTLGGLGIWTFFDFIMLILGSFEDGEGRPIKHK